MKITERFKKFAAITLAGAMILLTANSMSVHAQTISDVSVSRSEERRVGKECRY